jgi:SAM-dependent methyltransferase
MRWLWRERKIVPELMDDADPADARRSLHDLVRINTALGGHNIVKQLLKKAGCGEEPFSLLDVGAASGDTARVIRDAFPRATVVSLDRNAVNLSAAPAPRVLADAFALPFRPASFDYVFCSLFLHHFENDQVVRLLRGFVFAARRGVLISDLERHVVPYWFMRLSQPIFRWHWLTVHDGRISVRAAFTAEELRSLAQKAGLHNLKVATHRPAFRISLSGEVVQGS